MTLEQQVCSLELAKRLKELGVKQESLFYWSEQLRKVISREQFLSYEPYDFEKLQDDSFREAVDRTYSAFTVAELGEMLGSRINSITYYSNLKKYCWEKETKPVYVNSDTEADARAKMLIYLLENKLITV